jgi:hypothetical protein
MALAYLPEPAKFYVVGWEELWAKPTWCGPKTVVVTV